MSLEEAFTLGKAQDDDFTPATLKVDVSESPEFDPHKESITQIYMDGTYEKDGTLTYVIVRFRHEVGSCWMGVQTCFLAVMETNYFLK